jgi:hypothetical protein
MARVLIGPAIAASTTEADGNAMPVLGGIFTPDLPGPVQREEVGRSSSNCRISGGSARQSLGRTRAHVSLDVSKSDPCARSR